MCSAIVARGIGRTFGGKMAVDGIDIDVPKGEIFGFVGPNGAGKSTTVRMLCTLLEPTSGTATVAGFDVVTEADSVRRRIGVALQDAALDLKQTGRELLSLHGRLYGLTGRRLATRVGQVLDLVDIGASIDDLIGTYSGGMQRRLDLASALLHEPEIVFLDEPTTGLDPASRSRVWEEVRRLNLELGVTIFLTTQYLEEADAAADRLAIIDHGRIAAEGSPAVLKRDIGDDLVIARLEHEIATAGPLTERLRELPGVTGVSLTGAELVVGSRNGAVAVNDIVIALNEVGAPVAELTLRSPTLDDVFLQVTGSRLATDTSAETGSRN